MYLALQYNDVTSIDCLRFWTNSSLLNQTTLNEAGVVDPTLRDNMESGSHNKSIHNIESFQTFKHYIMYIRYYMGETFFTQDDVSVDNI